MKDLELNTSLAFDVDKQDAIVGWCIEDEVFCFQCSTSVKVEWFSNPLTAKLYGAVMAIYGEFHRKPTPQELAEYRPFRQEDQRTFDKITKEVLPSCLKKARSHYGLDLLRSEMTGWMHSVILSQSISQAVTQFNAKKVGDAWAIMEQASLLKATASFEDGVNQGFDQSSRRVVDERAERLAQSGKILKYGVGYLDDALGGIIPNDLIVLGAKTGAGKTQLATSIALANAQAGHSVYYFALEAENDEIERRIAYGAISTMYYAKVPKDKQIVLSYTNWRMCRHDNVLAEIEEAAKPEIAKDLKNLHTLYRTSGNFDLKALEKNLLKVVRKARLIVIDHLHYIDTSDDENSEYKRVIKTVRDIVLRFGVPIVVIAHLRKTQGRGQVLLMPSIEDFHGTSDVPKVATTCIMMAPARDRDQPLSKDGVKQKHLWPTYVGVVKSRLEGVRTRYVGMTHFDSRASKYLKEYRIGEFDWAGTEWTECEPQNVPAWANNALAPNTILTPGLNSE